MEGTASLPETIKDSNGQSSAGREGHSSSNESNGSKSPESKPTFKKAKRDNIRKRSESQDEDGEKNKKKHRHHSRSPDKRRKRSRSRDRKRHRDDDRKSKKRHHSRERSKSRKRSRSRDRSKRSRSRDRRHRRERSSRSPRHKRHRSSRRRSRDRHSRRRYSRSSSGSPYRFGYDKAMDAQERLARRLDRAAELNKIRRTSEGDRPRDQAARLQAIAARSNMSITARPAGANLNAEALSAQAQAEALAIKAKVMEETGVALPTYYNLLAINPLQYAQQQVKRKKLWNKNSEEKTEEKASSTSTNTAMWSKLSLGDEKTNEKFAKLMGIKSNATTSAAGATDKAQALLKKQNELFTDLDQQYEQARISTHTQRGVGLGFSSAYFNPNMLNPAAAAGAVTGQPPQQQATSSSLPQSSNNM